MTEQTISPPQRRWVLVGSPNSGKTTLFNALTGLRAKVANYPGVTVDWLEGDCTLPGGERLHLLDLPGTYSADALSKEEEVTLEVLKGQAEGLGKPDGMLFVADSTSLARTLPLLGAFLHLDIPIVLVLTMLDELKAFKGSMKMPTLRAHLGVPVVGIVGHRGVGIDDLKALLAEPKALARKTPSAPIPEDAEERFAWSDKILEDAYKIPERGDDWTDAIDRVLLHPVFGVLVFIATMMFFFQAIFSWAEPVKNLFQQGIGALSTFATWALPAGMLQSIVVDGVIAGVGSVVVFVPQIALLFLLLALFEQSGYLSRTVFVIDRMMGWIGLDGRCFVALLSSYACAVPGIMATRNIPDPKERLVTILMAPLMTCSARLPVYVLLIAAFVPARQVWGVFQLQGLVMFGLYLLGALSGLFGALVLRKGPLRGATLPFYIELPPYRRPTFMVLWRSVWVPVRRFLVRVGTVILVCSLILWALLQFPRSTPPQAVVKAGKQAIAAHRIEHSAAGTIGHWTEPVIAPLGFDWRIGIGLLASLAAREVLVSTLAQIYAVEGGADNKALTQVLRQKLRPPAPYRDHPSGSLAVALALLMFFVYSLQCVSTLAVMRRETGTWRWPAISFLSLLAVAYVAAFLTYRITLALG